MASGSKMQTARAVGRVLWRMGSNHRAVRGGVVAAKTMGKATARATRILLLEIIGFIFAVFAFMGFGASWQQWMRIRSGNSSVPMSHLVVGIAFSIVFVYFSVSSFLRAHKASALSGGKNG